MLCPQCGGKKVAPNNATYARTGFYYAPGTRPCPTCGGAPEVQGSGQTGHPPVNVPNTPDQP